MAMHDQMASVAEHSLVRAATPFVVAGILGLCGWLFTSVMSLEQQVRLLNDGTIINLEEKVDKLSEKIDSLDSTLTELRIMLGGGNNRKERTGRSL